MKLRSYNILFSLFSFLSDRTNGAPLFVKYKLLLGTLIIGLTGTTAHAQKTEAARDTISPFTPNRMLTTCYKVAVPSKYPSDTPDNIIDIKGRVKDEQGEYLVGVSINIKGTSNYVITDTVGAFSIKSKPTDKLVFSFIGMEDKEVPVSSIRDGEVIITMKDSQNVLCYEVVVIQRYPDDIYRSAPRNIPKIVSKVSYTEVLTPPVSPVGDLDAFQQWVQKNIRYSEQMKKDKLKGEVILSFAIDKKGKLVDQKVIGKLSKEADAEALRVLSLSGIWKPGIHTINKPIKTTMTISINFGDEK